MKRVLLIGAVLLLIGSGYAEARTVDLRATVRVQTADVGRYSKDALLETAIYVGKRLINPTLNAGGGCVVGWSWRDLSVRANSCAPRLRVKYVSFGQPVRFRFAVRRIG